MPYCLVSFIQHIVSSRRLSGSVAQEGKVRLLLLCKANICFNGINTDHEVMDCKAFQQLTITGEGPTLQRASTRISFRKPG
jgi:hypothetical protein